MAYRGVHRWFEHLMGGIVVINVGSGRVGFV